MTSASGWPAARHPAKWAKNVLPALAEVLTAEYLRHGSTVLDVLDPFAGVGRARLAEALGPRCRVVGIELEPAWAAADPDPLMMVGDALHLPEQWAGRFAVVATSPTFGNRMADNHEASDPCAACGGRGCEEGCGRCEMAHAGPDSHKVCNTCHGEGLSRRNTYRHALGQPLSPGSSAGLQWGCVVPGTKILTGDLSVPVGLKDVVLMGTSCATYVADGMASHNTAYREFHRAFIAEALRVLVPGGLLAINMSNHVRGGVEQPVVEWWVNELLCQRCWLHEVRRIPTSRQRQGANGAARVDGEVLIVMRSPT